jgi:hypothetical protein
MLPDELLKPQKNAGPKNNDRRTRRVLRLQGALNVLLAAALAASWTWFLHANGPAVIRELADEYGTPVRVVLSLHAYGEDRLLKPDDTVRDPVVTIYGRVEDYAALKDALPWFKVKIRRTQISPNERTGDFIERIVLKQGMNPIDVTLEWDGAEKERYAYNITYVKPESPVEKTGEMPMP